MSDRRIENPQGAEKRRKHWKDTRASAKESALSDDKKLRITICLPSRGVWPSGFGYDLARMMAYNQSVLVEPGIATIGLLMGHCTYVDQNRNDVAEGAIRAGATHMFWLDDDMRFPKDSLVRLLAHNVPIVGANYPTKKIPPTPTGIKEIGIDPEQDAERIPYKKDPVMGLEKVDALGFGVVLVRTEVFAGIEYPWFYHYWQPELQRFMGEDVDFCIRARESGSDVYVDHDLSNECAHVGTFEFRMEHVGAFEEDEDGNAVAGHIRKSSDDDQNVAE